MEQIGEAVWRVTGKEAGASLLIIGGMHGNEATGIKVVEQVRDSLREIRTGVVTAALGNPPAIARGERFIDGRDLNRYFTDKHLTQGVDHSWEETRARELSKLIRNADVTLDFHSTNRPSTPFISSKIDEEHERIYKWFPSRYVLEDPNYVLAGERATVDEYADAVGRVGVCIETGQASDVSNVRESVESIMGVLSELGIIGIQMPEPECRYTAYALTDAILLTEEGFTFSASINAHSFEPLLKGAVVGYGGSEALTMPEDGVIVFPKLPAHQQRGKPVVYIARRR